MNNFQLTLANRKPLWSIASILRHAVMIPSISLGLCPRPCNIQLLEIHVHALSTQPPHIGLHAKENILSAYSARNVYQNMFALPHQIKTLAMNVLQVRVANGRRASACHGI